MLTYHIEMAENTIAQIAFQCWANIGPTSAHPSVRRWPTTLAQLRQDTGKNYVLCIASANQIMYTNCEFIMRILFLCVKLLNRLLKFVGSLKYDF